MGANVSGDDFSRPDGMRFLLEACQDLNIDADLTSILMACSREIKVDLPIRRDDGTLTHFSGYRVHHHNALGPYKGGLRYHPDVNIEEFRWLARLMSLKTSLVGLPLGGAKGGIDCDPRLLSRKELQQLTRYFVRKVHRDIGPNLDIPAPDVGTNAQIMAWIHDEYSTIYGFSPAAVTGKPIQIGGAIGRETATGYGVAIVMEEYAKHQAEALEGATVVIQGFGNVGRHAARALAKKGARIVAVSDRGGAVFKEGGLDIDAVCAHKDRTRSVAGVVGAESIAAATLFALDCDYLVPAAIGHDIDVAEAKLISARVVVEAANNPTTYEAAQVLMEKGVVVLPDILVNPGGVIVSYCEWVQNLQQVQWSEQRVADELSARLQDACARVLAVETGRGCGLRNAAYAIAITRLKDAICTLL